MKDGLVRADTLPLVFRAIGSDGLARGSAVRVKVGAIDLLTLDLAASVVGRIESAAPAQVSEEEEDEPSAGPLAIAVDVAAPDAATEADPAVAAPA
jgi:exoribonuclease-2